MPTPKVEIFTKSDCTDSQAAKGFLTQKGIQFTEKNVTIDQMARQELEEKHQSRHTPTVVVNGTPVIGFGEPQKQKIEQLLTKKPVKRAEYGGKQMRQGK